MAALLLTQNIESLLYPFERAETFLLFVCLLVLIQRNDPKWKRCTICHQLTNFDIYSVRDKFAIISISDLIPFLFGQSYRMAIQL